MKYYIRLHRIGESDIKDRTLIFNSKFNFLSYIFPYLLNLKGKIFTPGDWRLKSTSRLLQLDDLKNPDLIFYFPYKNAWITAGSERALFPTISALPSLKEIEAEICR